MAYTIRINQRNGVKHRKIDRRWMVQTIIRQQEVIQELTKKLYEEVQRSVRAEMGITTLQQPDGLIVPVTDRKTIAAVGKG